MLNSNQLISKLLHSNLKSVNNLVYLNDAIRLFHPFIFLKAGDISKYEMKKDLHFLIPKT